MLRFYRSCVLFSLALLLLTTGQLSVRAQAPQSKEGCITYQAVVSRGASLPDKLLTADWGTGIRCLVSALDDLKPEIDAKATTDTWAQFVRATGIIRIIIANNEPPPKPDQPDPVNPAILEFRKNITLDAASSLAYGARAADDNARLNATLVFGNVVDNQSVCVALDHLYDPQLGPDATSYNIRGRANLLGVVSRVAPWSYMENYDNIERLRRYMSDGLAPLRDRPDLKQTFEILDNIAARLAFQDAAERDGKDVNKKHHLPPYLNACKYYRPKWAGDRMQY